VVPDLSPLSDLRRLAHALTHGDPDADDLLQETAIVALEHPPEEDRPTRPWFVAVLVNRWRMDRRSAARRRARELADDADAEVATEGDAGDALDRARLVQRLADALVALDEPYRTVVIRRYLDGRTAAQIAREQGIPAGTVRWRLKTGLERLRAELDKRTPRRRWQLALVPLARGAWIVKTKTKITWIAVLLALLAVGVTAWQLAPKHREAATAPVAQSAATPAAKPARVVTGSNGEEHTMAPLPKRATIEAFAGAGGVVGGQVVNWSTGDPVAGAELTFAGDDGAHTLRSDGDGNFELTTPKPGTFALISITAAGFLPYAPEYLHSPVHVDVANGQAIRGMRLFVYPAVDYFGQVVDMKGAPVAGARVKLLGTPDQTIYKLATEWTSDRDGKFTFHAPDFAVIEATASGHRGSAILDGKVAISKQMTIVLRDEPARDQAITGRVIDGDGHPMPDVLVTAEPAKERPPWPRVGAAATSGADGSFKIEGLDKDTFGLFAESEGFATARVLSHGGDKDVQLVLSAGELLAGTVATTKGDPIPAFTLLAFKRDGVLRELVATRSVADPNGHFEIRVGPGTYQVVASAVGWAPSKPVVAPAGSRDIKVTLAGGATVRGVVRSGVNGAPIPYARVQHEELGGGASAIPANTGTVTRPDGTFELGGVPAGPFSLSIGADSFHERIEGGLTATDGGELGPLVFDLTPLKPGESPEIELVGIGISLSAQQDALKVEKVFDGSGAAAVGIVAGDLITQVDGTDVTELGLEGAIARIRGVVGTTVAITLRRSGGDVTFSVQRRKLRA